MSFSNPIFDATSINPPNPTVELITNLVKSLADFFGFPCNNWFTDVSTSSRLLEKVCNTFFNSWWEF